MVTGIVVFLVIYICFVLIDFSTPFGGMGYGFRLAGMILAIIAGLCLMSVVGDKILPEKTTVLVSQQIEVLSVGSSENNNFYVQKMESDGSYVYLANGLITVVPWRDYQIEVVYENDVAPFVEYGKAVLDLPKGQGWKKLFGARIDLPYETVTFHIPQGSIYVVSK